MRLPAPSRFSMKPGRCFARWRAPIRPKLLVAPAIAALLLQPCAATAQDVFCSPAIGQRRIEGNLDVAVPCELVGTEIRGDVTLFAGGSLTARDVRIRGSLAGSRADFVSLISSRVDGEVRLEEMVGDTTRIERTNLRGEVLLAGNRSRLELIGNEIRRDVQAFGNTGGLLLVENIIEGDLECAGNTPAPLGADNRVSEGTEGQCEDLQPDAPSAPTPEPPAEPPPATPEPTPAPSEPPPASPTVPPATPAPTTPTAGFEPEPEGGGGGAIGLWWLPLAPLVVWRRLRVRRPRAG